MKKQLNTTKKDTQK